MLISLQGVQQFQVENDVELTAYIDKIKTCHKPADNPNYRIQSIDKYTDIHSFNNSGYTWW